MKQNNLATLILFLLVLGNVYALHPLKISVADVVYKDKKMHLKFKIFADDFGVELSEFCKQGIEFNNRSISSEMVSCMQKYVSQNFSFYINGTEMKFIFKNAKVEDGDTGIRVIWIEYESNLLSIESFNSVKVRNTLLFRFMGQQKNILNLDFFSGKSLETLRFDNQQGPVMQEIVFK